MSESVFVHKEPCPKCGSRNNLARYSDGHAHCFTPGCDYFEKGEGQATPRSRHKMSGLLEPGKVIALPPRKLDADTCKRFGYSSRKFKNTAIQIAPYRSASGEVVAQHVRTKEKEFFWLGDKRAALPLWGMWLWKDGGKRVTVTEGEIDCMTISKLQGNRWPVVSLASGAQGGKGDFQRAIEWLEKFEEVVLAFDMDDAGRHAAQECAALLSPGKAKLADLSPFKDASEMHIAGESKSLLDRLWQAQTWRPDGIVTVADVREAVLTPPETGLPWFSDALTKLTYGRRYGEVYAIGAGTGTGKTDFLIEQIEYDINKLGLPVAGVFLEQAPGETVKRILSKQENKLFYLPDSGWTQAELKKAEAKLEKKNRLFLYDHFGVANWDAIKSKIRFLNKQEGVRIFYIDHLTALATGQGDDERKELERIMGDIGGLVKQLDILVVLISHLATPDGKPHEEGGRVMIRHLKGSRAIGYWCHFIFGIERDQQAEDVAERTTSTFRILKDRLTGVSTGEKLYFRYNRETGRLAETNPFADETDPFNEENNNF